MNKLVDSTNPILHQLTQSINLQNEKEPIKELSIVMKKEDGIGIAAPQIGESKNLFLVYDVKNKSTLVFANMRILGKTKATSFLKEGCLSFPGVCLTIERPKGVLVEYETFNIEGEIKQRKEYFDGLNARVIQHEFDHVMGITFDMRIDK